MTGKKPYTIPCCAAEAMRRVRRIDIGGVTVGLSLLDCIFADVREMALPGEHAVREELMKRVKINNYVPPSAAGIYADAVYALYKKEMT
jgi:hypothetical protein